MSARRKPSRLPTWSNGTSRQLCKMATLVGIPSLIALVTAGLATASPVHAQTWVCAHPGVVNDQETTVIERYSVEGPHLVERGPVRTTRFLILQDSPDGLMAFMRPRVAGKEYLQVWVILIDKKSLR